MQMRFVQRQPGGPKVLQTRVGTGFNWVDVPLVEEWRTAQPVPPEPAETADRIYPDAD